MTQDTRARPRRRGFQPVQALAGLIGLVYLALGIIGLFITGFGGFGDAVHSTLWVFSINPLHNVFNIVIGVLGVLMAFSSGAARTYGWLLLVVFGVLLLWGLAITGVFAESMSIQVTSVVLPVPGIRLSCCCSAGDSAV